MDSTAFFATIAVREGGFPYSSLVTMNERTATQVLWRYNATAVLRRVTDAESRFAVSLKMNEVAILAAADELAAAARDATAWTVANPCPHLELGRCVALILNTCTEVALTAQRAISNPCSDKEAIIGRLKDQLKIDLHSLTLDDW